MENNQDKALPFITRDMLHFSYASRIQLEVRYVARALGSINIVGATKEGTFNFKFTTALDLYGSQEWFNLPDIPIWVSVIDEGETFKEGEVWIKLSLRINDDLMMSYCSGYVHQFKSLSWPSTQMENPSPFKGTVDVTSSADPAAGAQLTYTMDDGVAFKINAITFTLVTDATAANRIVHILFDPKQNGSFECISSVSQTASTTKKYHCIPIGTAGVYTDDNDIIIPIPADLILPGESKIQTTVTNMQAGDNLGVMTIHREAFIMPAN